MTSDTKNKIDKISSAPCSEAERLRTVSSMAGTIAHEFNNPLAVIRNSTDVLLMRESSDPALVSTLEKINKQIDRMKELVHRLLNIKDIREIDYAMGDRILDIHRSMKKDGDSLSRKSPITSYLHR